MTLDDDTAQRVEQFWESLTLADFNEALIAAVVDSFPGIEVVPQAAELLVQASGFVFAVDTGHPMAWRSFRCLAAMTGVERRVTLVPKGISGVLGTVLGDQEAIFGCVAGLATMVQGRENAFELPDEFDDHERD